MCMFYVFPVYFDGKFVGGALANWHGKLAPVVYRCFEKFRALRRPKPSIPKTI